MDLAEKGIVGEDERLYCKFLLVPDPESSSTKADSIYFEHWPGENVLAGQQMQVLAIKAPEYL